jgi:protein-S-isoprenylcysteine O-methyltransferase Ste14
MYVAVVVLIIGQALVFANVRLLEYGALIWLAAHLFVIGYEEPKLRATFGTEYEAFCHAVSRWIPRLHPY